MLLFLICSYRKQLFLEEYVSGLTCIEKIALHVNLKYFVFCARIMTDVCASFQLAISFILNLVLIIVSLFKDLYS